MQNRICFILKNPDFWISAFLLTSSVVIEIQKSYDPVSNTSVSIMPPKCEDGDCCLPTSFTYNFKCGICCSVFHTREEKTRHNLLHFIPCTMCSRPVHKNLFLEFPQNPGSFMLHFDRQTNVTLGVLLKYRSFIKFWEPPILQGRIHGAKLP